eukprot:g5839.t1
MDDEKETVDAKCLTVVLQKSIVGHKSVDHIFEDEIFDTKVTTHVYLQISINEEEAGVLILGLYGNAAPHATEKLTSLAMVKQVPDESTDLTKLMLQTLQEGKFNQIFPTQFTSFGIPNDQQKDSDEDAEKLKNELTGLKHDRAGMLSLDPKKSDLEFLITFNSIPDFDESHVIFGKVIYGMDLLSEIESLGDEKTGKPNVEITISSCGEINAEERVELIKEDQKRQLYKND